MPNSMVSLAVGGSSTSEDVKLRTGRYRPAIPGFTLLRRNAACCRRVGKLAGGTKLQLAHVSDVALPDECAAHCLRNATCAYFSHSTYFQDCFLCKKCQLEGYQSSMWFTSWQTNSSATDATTPAEWMTPWPTSICRFITNYTKKIALTRSSDFALDEPDDIAAMLHRRPPTSGQACVKLVPPQGCPTSLCNGLQISANAAALAFVGNAELIWNEQPMAANGTNLSSAAWIDECSSTHPPYRRTPSVDGDRACRWDLNRMHRNNQLQSLHGQNKLWQLLKHLAAANTTADDGLAKRLVRLGPHYAFGIALRWAFAFRSDRAALGLRGDDELRIAVHVRHFIMEDDSTMPWRERARVLAIEQRIRTMYFDHSQRSTMRHCAILLASDRRLTLTLFEGVATRTGCRLVTTARQAGPGKILRARGLEHGVDHTDVALRDLELLSHGHLLIGTWASSFTLVAQQLIASRYTASARRRGAPLPAVSYCCETMCEEPWPLLQHAKSTWSVELYRKTGGVPGMRIHS